MAVYNLVQGPCKVWVQDNVEFASKAMYSESQGPQTA